MDIAQLAHLSCDDALAVMWDYLDRELDVHTAERIAVHLWVCADCHHRFDVGHRFLEAIARTVVQPDTTQLRPRIQRALARARSDARRRVDGPWGGGNYC